MKTLERQPLLLVARQAVRVFAKVLALLDVLVARHRAQKAVVADAKYRVALDVGIFVGKIALLVAIVLVTGLAHLLVLITVILLVLELAKVDALWLVKELVMAQTWEARIQTNMVKKMRIVKIDSEDSNLIERKFYEYRAGRENISFLMKDKEVNIELLNEYIRIVEVRYYELEKTKVLMSKKYKPFDLNGKSYSYSFDFEEETIIYDEK